MKLYQHNDHGIFPRLGLAAAKRSGKRLPNLIPVRALTAEVGIGITNGRYLRVPCFHILIHPDRQEPRQENERDRWQAC
jgi:hypothetical protein